MIALMLLAAGLALVPFRYASLHAGAEFASLFLAGSAAFLYGGQIRVWWPAVASSAVLIAVAAVTPPLLPLVLPPAGAYVLIAIGLHSARLAPGFFRRFDLSYGTYLFGWPVGQFVLLAFGSHTSPWLLAAANLPLALACAFASWTLVESPFLRLKPHASLAARRLTHRKSDREAFGDQLQDMGDSQVEVAAVSRVANVHQAARVVGGDHRGAGLGDGVQLPLREAVRDLRPVDAEGASEAAAVGDVR